MSAGIASGSFEIGVKWKVYASGGTRDLVADSPTAKHAARRIIVLSDCDITHLGDKDGNDVPITGVKAGFIHDAYTTTCEVSTGSFIAYW